MSGIIVMIVASVVLLFLLFYSMACYGWFAMQSEEKQTQWFYARKGQPQDLLSQGTIFTDAFLPLFLLLLGAAVVLWIQIPSLAPSLYLRWIFPLFFVAAIVLGLVLAVVAKNNSGRVFAPLQKLLRLMGWGAANMYRKEVGVLPQNNSQQLMEERQSI